MTKRFLTGTPDPLNKLRGETRAAINRTKIIAVIQQIPRGMVSTYGAVAKAAGLPRGARQAAAALRKAVGLPWHRVLGSGGEIKLRGNSAFEQRFRLEAEGIRFRGRRVDIRRHEYKFPRYGRR
ncbi:MAG: cysteine methyltransferase [Acidobacteria bacterium]|nr:MAG: cysteine methyltransferase [Acidobacteriota bacterium]